MKRIEILLNKTIYLGLSVLETKKMYDFWYDYVKAKYGQKSQLCNMDTDRFIVFIKIEDIYIDIAKGVEIRFDTSYYELGRSLPRGKNKTLLD